MIPDDQYIIKVIIPMTDSSPHPADGLGNGHFHVGEDGSFQSTSNLTLSFQLMMSYLLINIIPNRCLTLNFSLAKLCLVLLLTISLDSKCWLSASPSPSHDVSVIFSDLLDILPISQMLMLLDADDRLFTLADLIHECTLIAERGEVT